MLPPSPGHYMTEEESVTPGKLYARRNSWSLFRIWNNPKIARHNSNIWEVLFEGTAQEALLFIEQHVKEFKGKCLEYQFVPTLSALQEQKIS
jgi:hypothetical protein